MLLLNFTISQLQLKLPTILYNLNANNYIFLSIAAAYCFLSHKIYYKTIKFFFNYQVHNFILIGDTSYCSTIYPRGNNLLYIIFSELYEIHSLPDPIYLPSFPRKWPGILDIFINFITISNTLTPFMRTTTEMYFRHNSPIKLT